MRTFLLTFLLIGHLSARQVACQEVELPAKRAGPNQGSDALDRTLKTARISGAHSRQAYFELLCEYLASKQEVANAFDLTTVAIVNDWHSDLSYKSAHNVLGGLDVARAIGLERSTVDNKGLGAIWLVETTDKQTWLVSSRDGILVLAIREGTVGWQALMEKAEKICERSQVNVAPNVIDGTVHSIVVLNNGRERVRICYDLPDDITIIWRELNTALLREDTAVRRDVSRQILRE